MPRPHVRFSRLFTTEGFFSYPVIQWLQRQPNAVLLETTSVDNQNYRSYIFHQPVELIQAYSLDQVESSLTEVDRALKDGYYVAGFLAYEAGYAFERSLRFPYNSGSPLIWFGVYEKPIVFDHLRKRFEGDQRRMEQIGAKLNLKHAVVGRNVIPTSRQAIEREELRSLLSTMGEDQYRAVLQKIKTYIGDGDTYQVNFTFKMKFPFEGNTAALYCALRKAQRVAYSALINAGTSKILSFSPELFFRMDGEKLMLKPMKGTAPRGRTLDEDEHQRRWLLDSEKDRAENLMIVDLLRNDAGRVARIGSVSVPKFFEIEQYETVLQATSTIRARLKKNLPAAELLRSLFPSGSVTGAPKIRTMQIIRELEGEPRGVYTGSIGFFAPDRKAVFNVAIRTVVLDGEAKTAEMGIGSGVTAGSVIEKEYQECLLKAKFLKEQTEDFQLFETMRWDPKKGWFLLGLHLKRLKESAKYFGFRFEKAVVLSELRSVERSLKKISKGKKSFRVRLTLDRSGRIGSSRAPLESLGDLPLVGISSIKTDSNDRFFFHKTTRRKLYDEELKKALERGWFDVLFFNERDELTEGARTNVIIRKGEMYYTPPIGCGILSGTCRAYLLTRESFSLKEKILHLDDLTTADEIFICNALRELVKVEVVLRKQANEKENR